MSTIDRRQFLKLTGMSAASFAMLKHQTTQQGDRYGRVLAQETTRKRALLVGINNYPSSDRFTPLQGCTTDVQLQRELLVHRFGFHSDNVLMLSDDTSDKPTRANILRAFEEHLIKPSQEGDAVVFHFSGHGSQVIEPDSPDGDDMNSTFVPADAANDTEIVNDIMGRTLYLLTSALKTEHFCGVLDSCYAGGGTRGNVRVRSAWDGKVYQSGPEELEYQNRWLREREVPFSTLQEQRRISVAKGIMLAAAREHEEAVDVGFDGFYAGAFTYLLTQYLWQQTDSHAGTMARITQDMKDLSGQVPFLDAQADRQFRQSEMFFVPPSVQIPPAEAVITEVDGNEAEVWFGGVDPESLSTFGPRGTLTPAGLEDQGEVEILSRSGMRGRVQLPTALPEGTLLQEVSRVISPALKLRIGLDSSLGEKVVDVQSRLSNIARVEGVRSQPGAIPYEGEIHYVLSVMTADYRQRFAEDGVVPGNIPAVGQIGLFTRGLDKWLIDSFIEGTIGGGGLVSALLPKLQLLLAARLVKATLKANSTRLQVACSLVSEEIAATPELLDGLLEQGVQAVNTRDRFALPAINFPTRNDSLLPHQIPLSADFRFVLQNQESESLYVGIVVIASDGRFFVQYPANTNSQATANAESLMQPDETQLVPSREVGAYFFEELGRGEILVIASREPFFPVLKQLETLTAFHDQQKGDRKEEGVVADTNVTLTAVNGLLTETRTGQPNAAPNTVVRTAEMSAYAISFEVVEV